MDFLPRRSLFAAALACAIVPTLAASDEAALYDTAAPADAVFVRVLAEYTGPAAQVPFGENTLPFQTVDQDTYVAISAAQLSGVTPGAYYSLASNNGAPMMIKEPARETAAKVHLILVNTSDSPVRLVVAGRNMEVVSALAPGQADSRAVNPVSATLAVERVDTQAILGTFDVALARGSNVTFVASNETARLVEHSFGPVLSLD